MALRRRAREDIAQDVREGRGILGPQVRAELEAWRMLALVNFDDAETIDAVIARMLRAVRQHMAGIDVPVELRPALGFGLVADDMGAAELLSIARARLMEAMVVDGRAAAAINATVARVSVELAGTRAHIRNWPVEYVEVAQAAGWDPESAAS